ncbi:MAG: hypothetical protein ACLP7A_00225 [Desulfobaccales bacterium]
MSRQSGWLVVLVAFIAIFVMSGTPVAASQKGTKAKYVFLFIGDGMAVAQRNAAELYLAKEKLTSTIFPQRYSKPW